ncbi:hypothetical protein BJY00DRAFT_291433 [Aspergillus carlsbadensis]|nr:hypothetical protein BJY00DRAFT_291433 [Aspergillus carlsbadensis]
MSLSTPRSSASRAPDLTVPATQGTAPVLKFRCLFTHDLRRKAKRWQDGFLRFHTFNKRVMVYDNGGYFIGDLHYRAPESIQDGDELELDKGVLIQVCETVEQTETDISLLYRNKATTSPSQPNVPPTSARSPAPRPLPSQQASRSLNDLLGIRKTPAPQLQPPYEQRQRQVSIPRYERPAKRQRTASPEQTSPSSAQGVVDLSGSPPRNQQTANSEPRQNRIIPQSNMASTGSSALNQSIAALGRPSQLAQKDPTSRPQNNTLIQRPVESSEITTCRQSGTNQHRPSQPTLPDQQRAPISRHQNNTVHQRQVGSIGDTTSRQPGINQHRPPQSILRDQRDPTTRPQNSSAGFQKTPESNGAITSRQSDPQNRPPQSLSRDTRPSLGPDPPINPLRLTCSNPRRKLMYRESSSPRPQSDPEIKLEPTSSDFMISDDELFNDDNLVPNQPQPQSSEPRSIKQEEDLDVSFTEAHTNNHNLVSGSNSRQSTYNSVPSERLLPQNLTTPGPPPPRTVPWLRHSRTAQRHVQPQRALPANTNHQNPGIGSNSRAFLYSIPPERQPPQATVPSGPSNPPSRTVPTPPLIPFPRPRSAVLRKSYSDPSAINSLQTRPLTTTTNSPLNPATDTTDHSEQGPWTSEALDLFDFWPPGRPKPT